MEAADAMGLGRLKRRTVSDALNGSVVLGEAIPSEAEYMPENAVVRSDLKKQFKEILIELGRNEVYGKQSLTFHEVVVLNAMLQLKSDIGDGHDTEEIAETLGIDRRKVVS